jgi:type IV fimbrial biogenesis protein FimT
MDKIRQQGFTLLELMVTLFIASILLGLAVPSFRDMSTRNRLVTYTNDFISSINLARSEAVRRGAPVSICHSDDGTSCSGTWNDGWITFADADGNGEAGDPDDEPVLRVHEPLDVKYSLAGDPAIADGVTFTPDGSATAGGVFAVCHDGNVVGARAIVLTRLRPRVALDANGNRIPNLDAGELEDCADPSGV